MSRSRSRSRLRLLSFIRPRSRLAASSFVSYVAHSPHKDRIYLLYRLLMLELNLPAKDGETPVATNTSLESIVNMVQVPFALERFIVFGLLVCLNSFLTLFTLAPLKVCILAYKSLTGPNRLHLVKRDIITLALIWVSVGFLSVPYLDILRMYHDVRGQAHIKLYVMFGVLEVGDKLCLSLGQDILNVLYTTTSPTQTALFFALALVYLVFHLYICIYQTVSLNVAANSYSNALLTLLLLNQFAELKSLVFKKFEREGLFQLAMADLSERFHLSLMLGIIGLRNLLQLNLNHFGIIPTLWNSWNRWLGAIFGPSVVVLGSEILVDWLKHCYITRFNRIRPRVYRNFLYVLSLDFLDVFKQTPDSSLLHELTDYIVLTKRIGLPLLALTVCFLRMTLSDLQALILGTSRSVLLTLPLVVLLFVSLLFIRLILGLVILRWAGNISREDVRQREKEVKKEVKVEPNEESDIKHEFQSTPDTSLRESSPDLSFLPGDPNTEPSAINPSTRLFLYNADEPVPPTVEERRQMTMVDDTSLDRVLRYEMAAKRIW